MTTNLHDEMVLIGERARRAAEQLRSLSCAVKDKALRTIAEKLTDSCEALISENNKDLDAGKQAGLTEALLDRLTLNEKRIAAMAESLRQVASLPDPVGEIVTQTVRPNGLRIAQIRQPLGVVGIIYESRPNVTADAAALCLKSGNAAILRGGSEAIHSNIAIADVICEGIREAGAPEYAVQVVATTDRAAVGEMLRMDKHIDVIVPRGGKSLIERIYAESRIPVVAHLDGVCHTYVHADADLAMAKKVCLNAKLQRPGVCNAMETLLVHKDIAKAFLPDVADALVAGGCELRGCERTQAIISCKPATEEDWLRSIWTKSCLFEWLTL